MLRTVTFLFCALLTQAVSAGIQRVSDLSFERVVLHGSAKLEITQGDAPELAIRGSKTALAKKVFYLDGDTLILGRGGWMHPDASGVDFKLTVSELNHLKLIGSGDIYVKPLEVEDFSVALEGSGQIKMFSIMAKDLTLRLSGSGDMQAVVLSAEDLKLLLSGSGAIHLGEVFATNAEVSVKGSGDITAQKSGGLDNLNVKIVGSGDVDLKPVRCDEVEVNIMGSGDATVHAGSELDVGIVGSGDVYYTGEPEIEQSILGSGELHRRKSSKLIEQRE
ncbi:MAG: head GIN domain-containing protein [Halioglobus sp.]